MKRGSLLILTLAACLVACNPAEKQDAAFELLRKDETGLDFENVLEATSQFNVFNYMYFFNGGGVAAGDFNNDGLMDLYFTSNMGPNKLFLNEGNLKFKDVTETAGVAGLPGWTTGASVVDIDNDGKLDIYVGQMGDYQGMKGQNQLFVCREIRDGVPVFTDEAAAYGLDLAGFATQAAFFDYDLDGDLDLYQLNHSLHQNGTFGKRKEFEGTQHPTSGDKLLRNDGGKFTEVTLQAGIKSTVIGYGLGIVASDIDNDGWPDLYIGNDFHENDYLYINQRDGTFREQLTEHLMHTSRFSMGVDVADINNDGWNEIFSLDMLPEDPYILKTSLGEDGYNIFQFKLGFGYNHQYARNNLQLNNGDGTFSEIGIYSGVFATDWSWATLFFDLDNDGFKDIFVSNGIERRMNDIDYINYRETHDIRFKVDSEDLLEEDLVIVEKMPQVKLPNKFYRNTGDLKFADLASRISNDQPTFSNGAVTADLDNDGDLDVVVNNLRDEPFVYRNLAVENGANGHYLSLALQGPPANRQAIGARAIVFQNDKKIVYENYPVRGYQSSCQAPLHIGIGENTAVDSVLVVWPDRTFQRLTGVEFDKKIEVAWQAGLPVFDFGQMQAPPATAYRFDDAGEALGLDFQHRENEFVQFNREGLIPHMVSAEGPALAVGDVNGDGLEDVFFGNAKRERSVLYLQTSGGRFVEKPQPVFQADSLFEDVDAVFVDLDNDGDLDLVVAAGGNEFRGKQEAMKQRAYLNDGQGNLQRMDFPEVFMTASCVLPADFDGDGLTDLFFGARALPWNYGLTPTSVLLRNKGGGEFENVTEQIGGGLHEAGLVKNGTWTDLDGDGDPDLLLAIEWEPPTVFLNNGGQFEKRVLGGLSGWWNVLLPHDFDRDGDLDILAGNLGQNTKLRPTPATPVRMYVNDYDDNDQVEQVLTYYLGGKETPFANHAEILKQLPPLKKKFLYSADFAKASLEEIFGKEKLAEAVVREVNTLDNLYFENTGGLNFKAHLLPARLQFAPLCAAAVADFDGDGSEEVLTAGNFYESNIEMGRYDASYGNVLSISKNGEMTVSPLGGVHVKDQVRRIEPVRIGGSTYFILAKNDGKVQVLRPKTGQGADGLTRD